MKRRKFLSSVAAGAGVALAGGTLSGRRLGAGEAGSDAA